MNLNERDWAEFRVGDLFKLEPTKGVVSDDLIEGSDVPYIAAKHDDNGMAMYCSKDGFEDWISKGNCIIFINLGAGSAGYANYINEDFIGMSGKTTCGYNDNLNEYNGTFIATILCQERPKYSFGRSWTGDRLKDTIIKLPVDANSEPDWQFMEDYIKSLHHKPLTTKNKSGQVPALNVQNWKYFLLKDICKITMGNKMDATAMTTDNPEYNFVGRSADDNGVAMKVDAVYTENDELIEPYPAGCITVALGGSLGSTYLQKEPFYTSQNVSVLEFPKEASDSAKLFLCTLIHNESLYKYFPFGRELNTHIRTDFGFTLPVDSDGNPDWQFMEDYIKALPYGDRLEG